MQHTDALLSWVKALGRVALPKHDMAHTVTSNLTIVARAANQQQQR